MAAALTSGIYELYYTTFTEIQPLGLDSIDGQPPQVVQLPVGSAAPLWTVTKVATDTFTLSVGGAFVAPSSIWIQPSSTAYRWKVQKRYTVPAIGGEESYAVWTNDGARGWTYLVLGGRRGLMPRQPIGELQLYLENGYAAPWWFKKVG
ncbi:hypothetical protein FPV67DRAFT_1666783 [Lyophyllum atratum]|nr:hypothetical protein FPV67DRAFT_1666783 [Lyophyllum atratum]